MFLKESRNIEANHSSKNASRVTRHAVNGHCFSPPSYQIRIRLVGDYELSILVFGATSWSPYIAKIIQWANSSPKKDVKQKPQSFPSIQQMPFYS